MSAVDSTRRNLPVPDAFGGRTPFTALMAALFAARHRDEVLHITHHQHGGRWRPQRRARKWKGWMQQQREAGLR